MNLMKQMALVFLFLGAHAFALSLEVVESVPLETDLGVPGVRQTQEVWLEMIKGANKTLDIEQFYISEEKGQLLTAVLDEIKTAAGRGVKVRLLVDAKFFKTYPETVTALGNVPNIESRTIEFGTKGGVQHAKFFIVDGKDSFVGSQNFDWRALNHIHELGLRVQDESIARDLQSVFDTDWASGKNVAGNVEASKAGETNGTKPSDISVVGAPADILPKGIGYSADAITSLMGQAKERIRIEVMTYLVSSPFHGDEHAKWQVLDSAMREAAGRGVKVQLVVEESAIKKGRPDLLALARIPNIQVKTVTIPAWSGGKIDYARLIHSKFMLIDDQAAWLGTENWSSSYFLNTRDVGFVTSQADAVQKMGLVYDKLWNSAYAKNIH
jgi:phosphatidylserine/phosphatidylglycerophosphate/cardiolipin synthase-like enzyme